MINCGNSVGLLILILICLVLIFVPVSVLVSFCFVCNLIRLTKCKVNISGKTIIYN